MCSHSYNTKVLPRDGLANLDWRGGKLAVPVLMHRAATEAELSSSNLLPQ
jgi:hypothetical protein